MTTHMERLKAVRASRLPAIGQTVHQNRLLRLAREGAQTAAYQIEEYEASRRYATLVATVQEAGKLARDESFDHLRLVGDYYSQLRRYEPEFLSILEFRGAPVVTSLLAAIDCLRSMNDNKLRKVPESAPTEFLRK